MSKLLQITDDDLAEMERIVPEILGCMYSNLDNRLRVQFRKLKTILSNVRWNYGPPLEVMTIAAEPEDDEGEPPPPPETPAVG